MYDDESFLVVASCLRVYNNLAHFSFLVSFQKRSQSVSPAEETATPKTKKSANTTEKTPAEGKVS